MQFGHLQAVLLAQQLASNQRRAGVVAQLAATVEVLNDGDIRLQLGGQVILLPDAGDAFEIFTGTLGVFAAQLIAACAGVGVQIKKRFFFLFERFNDQALNGVFKNVGVVACVKAMTITEHGYGDSGI
ncbi:Uncharacterised protein [Klebsiella pneumoniae]|nr:Uncharacterised protein [Klebsiella pneumoniae]